MFLILHDKSCVYATPIAFVIENVHILVVRFLFLGNRLNAPSYRTIFHDEICAITEPVLFIQKQNNKSLI